MSDHTPLPLDTPLKCEITPLFGPQTESVMRIVGQKNPKWTETEKVRMENPPKKAKKRKKKLSDHTPLPLDPPLKCQDTP